MSLSLDGTGATPRWLDPLDLVHGQGAAGDLHNPSRSSGKLSGGILKYLVGFYLNVGALASSRDFPKFPKDFLITNGFILKYLIVIISSTDILVFLSLAFYVMS